jgi:hypothetical protein
MRTGPALGSVPSLAAGACSPVNPTVRYPTPSIPQKFAKLSMSRVAPTTLARRFLTTRVFRALPLKQYNTFTYATSEIWIQCQPQAQHSHLSLYRCHYHRELWFGSSLSTSSIFTKIIIAFHDRSSLSFFLSENNINK